MNRLFKKIGGPIWLTTAHGSHALFQWLFVVIIGRLFGMAELGFYTSAMAVLTPIVLLAGLNSRGVQLADVAGSWRLRDVFVTRLAGMTLAMVCVGAYLTFFVGFDAVVIWLVLFSRMAAEAISEPIHTWLIASGKFKTFAVTYLVRSVLAVGAFSILAYLGAPLVACLAIWSLSWIVILAVRDLRFGGFTNASSLVPVNVFKVKTFIVASLPLAAVGAINSLYVSIPILFLTSQYGLEQVGIYSAVSYVNMVVGLFVGAVTLSSARATAVAYSQGLNKVAKERVHRQLIFVIACGFPALLAMFLFGEVILEFVYDADSSGYRAVIVVQLSAVLSQAAASVCGVAATAAGRNLAQVVIGVACIVVQFVLCWLLVPAMGPLGAAVGTLSSLSLKAVCLYVLLPRAGNAGGRWLSNHTFRAI